MLAAHSWTIGASTSAVTQHVSTPVGISAQNTSSNDGGGESIGCIEITIPGAYEVESASIDAVSGGYAWTSSVSGSGPTVVTFAAVDDHNRLYGDPQFVTLDATITVSGSTVGQGDWSAVEYEHWDCTKVQGPTVTLPMQIDPGSNGAPSAGDDAASVVAGNTLTVPAPGVLADDTDPEDDPLVAVLESDVADGTLTLDADGSYTYVPDPGFSGTDAFTYRASDGSDASAPATVTISVTNVAPSAADDAYVAAKNVLLSVDAASGVLANDTDPDPGQTRTATVVTPPATGTLDLASDGSFTFQPLNGMTGTETFTYSVTDGVTTSAPATVSITVSNQAPVAIADTYSVHMGILLLTGAPGVLANDTDPNGDPLTASLVSTTSNGTLLLNSTGGFTYVPNLFFAGTDSFVYRVSDGHNFSSPATVTIGVTNGQPIAVDDAASGSHDRQLAGSVLDNDADPDDDGLAAVLETDVATGTLALAPDGTWTYDPPAGFVGTTSFTYRATDGAATSAPATVTITITNAAPIANDDALSVHHANVAAVAAPGVLGNDADADGDGLAAALVASPAHGTATLDADGAWTYDPAPGYTGPDAFSYTVTDGLATSAAATVTLSVTNADPVAVDDAATVHHASTLTGTSVLANDTDPDGDALAAALATDVANGTLTLRPDGTYDYDPDPGFVGTDSFTYVASDGATSSLSGTVTISVTDTAPITTDDTWSVAHDRPLVVAAPGVLGNDVDPDGDAVGAALVSGPTNGVLTFGSDGRFRFDPAARFVGSDSFVYEVDDGALTATATVTIEVTNLPPAALADAYTVVSGDELVVGAARGVLENDTDPDGDALSTTFVAAPAHGTLVLTGAGSVRYTPDAGFVGVDGFTYVATDGIDASAATRVRITVEAAPPAPSPAPRPDPTPDPAPDPAASPDPSPTPDDPSPEPSSEPTPEPSASPTPAPSDGPGTGAPSGGAGGGGAGSVERWSIGDGDDGDPRSMPIANLASSTLGIFGKAFDWLVPGAITAVPGLLLILAILAQAGGALAWLPVVRRKIGGFGLSSGSGPARR